MAKRRKKYPMEFKLEAVRLITEQNLSFAEVGDDLGVNRTTIRDWVRRDVSRYFNRRQGAAEKPGRFGSREQAVAA
jgi:transposase